MDETKQLAVTHVQQFGQVSLPLTRVEDGEVTSCISQI